MRVFFAALALFGVPLAFPTPAAAWHRDGHMAISRIAWKQLTEKQIIEVSRILKAHPHYDIYLAAERPKSLTEPEWVFCRASTWSDWVRDPFAPGVDAKTRAEIKNKFNKSVWHYVDLPYIHPNDVGKFDADAIRKEILLPEFDGNGEPRHALAALKYSMKKLTSADTSDAEKAVYLCWLFHLVGDLHQPLHGTMLIAAKATFAPGFAPPSGDQGGNLLAIRAKAGDTRYVKLHAYWDALLFSGEPGFPTVDAVVAGLLKDAKYQRDQLPELKSTEFLDWAEESLELAKTTVYKGDGGFLKAYGLGQKGGDKVDSADVPLVPEGYQKAAEAVAARRMMLAGYRLADQLALVVTAAKSNLGSQKEFDASMKPEDQINVAKLAGLDLKMARLYNERGKYLQEKAKMLGVDASALAAVLQVESGGRGFGNDGRMTVRFENHIFYKYWGASHQAEFGKHFKFAAKETWKGHEWRKDPAGSWQPCHKNQAQEWETFNFAQTLDEKAARLSVSYGAGQVMGFNHKTVGFKDVNEMFDKMNEGIKPQLEAVVSFIKANSKCMKGLQARDYVLFATGYNGTARAAVYGASIQTAAEAYEKVTKK